MSFPISIIHCLFDKISDCFFSGNATITFGFTYYNPPCVKISVGASVTFSGDFGSHPLHGGEYPVQ
jgi:hypothetical protein